MPPRPPRDRPGPHPENQLKRRELRGPRRSLIGVDAIVAVLAAVVLAGRMTSVSNGLTLVLLVGVTQGLAAFLLAIHHVEARKVALGAALLAIGWAVAQILLFDEVTRFSLTLLGVGVFEAMLVASCTPRDSGKRKKMRGRP